MKIKNTTSETTFPWPEGMFIQGREESEHRDSAFIEASPPEGQGTYIRTDAATLVEAEEKAWARYQLFLYCEDETGEHGPYESRKYENGAGYCTKCGMWFSKVLEPSLKWVCSERAYEDLGTLYGEGFLWHPSRQALVKQEAAILLAVALGETPPERTVEPPTQKELDDLVDPKDIEFTGEDIAAVLDNILNTSRSIETPVENDATTP